MIRQLAHLLSFSLLATGCTFVLQTVATHNLNPSEYGRFAKWLTDINFWGLFFVLGLDNSILYFAKNKIEFGQNVAKNLKFFSFLLAMYLFGLWIVSAESLYYVSLGITIFMLAVYQTLNAANQHAENFRVYGAFVFIKALGLLLPFLAVFLMDLDIGISHTYLMYSIASVILVIIIFLYGVTRMHLRLSPSVWKRDYFWYGVKSMTNTLLAVTLYTATVYCLDFLGDPAAVGFFFIAAAISKLAWVVPDAVGNILYPKYLRIGVDRTEYEVMESTYFYAQLVFLINIFAFVIFVSFGEFLIRHLYAPGYAAIYLPTCVLLIGNQGMVFYKILGRYFASKDQWHVTQRALIFGSFSNVIFNIVLIPSFGVLGAAIATAISFWICGLSVAFMLKGSFFRFLYFPEFFKKLST